MSEATALAFGVIAKLSDGTVRQVAMNQEQYDSVHRAIRVLAGPTLRIHEDILPLSLDMVGKAVGNE